MAARNKATHDYKTRQKIQISQLINSLTNHVLGKSEMSSTQVRAAEILLKKTLPDLQQTTIEGGDNPVNFAVIDSNPLSTEQWLEKHASGDPKTDHSTH